MADPVAYSRAAAVTGVMGQLFGGVQQRSIAEDQAALLDQEAKIVGQQTRESEAVERRQARAALSQMAAAMNEGGVAGGDTARKAVEQAGTNLELDALNLRYAGQLRQRGLKYQSAAAKEAGRNALLSGIAGSGAAALMGMADVGYYKTRRELLREY